MLSRRCGKTKNIDHCFRFSHEKHHEENSLGQFVEHRSGKTAVFFQNEFPREHQVFPDNCTVFRGDAVAQCHERRQ